eukprot:571391-Prymnesium_polylepis.1
MHRRRSRIGWVRLTLHTRAATAPSSAGNVRRPSSSAQPGETRALPGTLLFGSMGRAARPFGGQWEPGPSSFLDLAVAFVRLRVSPDHGGSSMTLIRRERYRAVFRVDT